MECGKSFYKGKLLLGSYADITTNGESLLQIQINNTTCLAQVDAKASYQLNKILFTFNSIQCKSQKIIKVKGQVLDYECLPGIKAKHVINKKAIKYLEERLRLFPSNVKFQKELIKTKFGYLETEQKLDVFVQIYEPMIFLHKDKINKFGY
ncbi:hypothetical protein [Arcobacter sp.]|uniref:hypothetical protein n=1 Tax=Arcobacter sp. TaxID=1872629 RepID=UPI003C75CFD3